MEHPIKIKMDDLGVPLFVETPMCFMICVFHHFSIHPECLNLSWKIQPPNDLPLILNHQVGDKLTKGQILCVLESMKMVRTSNWEGLKNQDARNKEIKEILFEP